MGMTDVSTIVYMACGSGSTQGGTLANEHHISLKTITITGKISRPGGCCFYTEPVKDGDKADEHKKYVESIRTGLDVVVDKEETVADKEWYRLSLHQPTVTEELSPDAGGNWVRKEDLEVTKQYDLQREALTANKAIMGFKDMAAKKAAAEMVPKHKRYGGSTVPASRRHKHKSGDTKYKILDISEPIVTLWNDRRIKLGSKVICARNKETVDQQVIREIGEVGEVSMGKHKKKGVYVKWSGEDRNGKKLGTAGSPSQGFTKCSVIAYTHPPTRRRMAQREHSNRRDSPVMVRLLEQIIDAQDD